MTNTEEKINTSGEAKFPIHRGTKAPWNAVRAYVPLSWLHGCEQRAQRNHNQTIARLAERGGLSPHELYAVAHDCKHDEVPPEGRDGGWIINRLLQERDELESKNHELLWLHGLGGEDIPNPRAEKAEAELAKAKGRIEELETKAHKAKCPHCDATFWCNPATKALGEEE